MPTYILDQNRSARLSRGALTIRLQADQRVRLMVTDQGRELVGLVRPTATMLVIPRVPDRAVITVLPDRGRGTFDPGTVSITISVDQAADSEPDQVVIPDVELAGLGARDLGVLEADARGVVVTGTADRSGSARLASILAERARVAAREILGGERVPAEAVDAVVIALDHSASMGRCRADGSARAAVDLVVGVASVIATGRPVTARLLSEPPFEVGWREGEDLAGELEELAVGRPLTVGFRSAAAAQVVAVGRARVYVVTDAVPPDVDAFAAACATGGLSPHLVLLGERPALEPESRALAVPCTIVDLRGTAGGGRFDDRGALVAAVRSLARIQAPPTAIGEGDEL